MSAHRLSGWRSPDCGPRAHATCQDRIDRGLLAGCGCEGHGGVSPVKQGDSGSEIGRAQGTIGAQGGPATRLTSGAWPTGLEST